MDTLDTGTLSQPAEALRERLRRAEAGLKAASTHFRALRRAAFSGRYDPDLFDQAVLACRAAEAELLGARYAAARAVPDSPPDPETDTGGGGDPGAPDPLARLRFARWLVQTGRLSEETAA